MMDRAALAKQLLNLQAAKNDGRGVQCVRSLAFYLEQVDVETAQACARNEWDKIESYPDIAELLIEHGLYTPINWDELFSS